MSNYLESLTLGTVQLGLPYGVANQQGLPSSLQARAVLDAAWAGGVRWLDTARVYGESEARIGDWTKATGCAPRIVSKLPPILSSPADIGQFVNLALAESLASLQAKRIEGYLAHRVGDLLLPGTATALLAQIGAGAIGGFGASVYTCAEADQALMVAGLSMIQLPLSLLDSRAITFGVLDRCLERGIRVFARSVFLQGALLLDPVDLPGHLVEARPAIARLRSFADELGRSLAELAVVAVRDTPGVASVVLGMETIEQVQANLKLINAPSLSVEERREAFRLASALPETVIHPGLWPKG